ncbi:TetR family transcriptional regulator [Acetobacterium malicum]|jgi:AcrR family transcriptional regulator|uniref:TetR family transcriptional regulator n=2 Tax=Acetobacterium malicum TaxID=52692 RepID=A0ABR6Z1A2_9FIRM|nr:TetR family transcriptional regulator [Acetobacterium malicum]
MENKMIPQKLSKGLQTKISMINAAKMLFHQNGFKKTSAKEICEKARVNHKNFNYYFKSKDSLLTEIYSELYMKSYSFIESKITYEINSIEKNTFAAYIYYSGIFVDENTIRFQQEIYDQLSSSAYMGQNFNHVYHQFFRDMGKEIDQDEIDNIRFAELGLRRELILRFIENPGNKTIYDVITTMHLYRGRLLQMDETLTKSYLFNALEFEHKHDHSHIRLLI